MKSVIASISIAVLAGLAQAVQFTNSAYDVTADEALTLTWSDGVGPYQILLKDGPSTDLDTVSTLVASTTAESAVVTLPSTLTTGTYAFQIVDTSDSSSNYSPQFAFVGAAATPTVTSASSTTTVTSATSASSTTSTTSITSESTITSSSSASASASTSGSSSTLATSTTSSSSTRTSASTSASSTVVSTNNAAGVSAPFAAIVLAGAIAAAF